jgi:hypothetical protein
VRRIRVMGRAEAGDGAVRVSAEVFAAVPGAGRGSGALIRKAFLGRIVAGSIFVNRPAN